MPTVIDALLVTLNLDNSGFVKGGKQTAEALKKTRDDVTATSKELQERGKHAAEFFGKIAASATAMFAVFTAGKSLKDFVHDIATTNAALGRLAPNLGLSVEQLSKWRNAMEAFGGSAQDADAAFQGFATLYQNMLHNIPSESGNFLSALGMKPADLKNAEMFLLKTGELLSKRSPMERQWFAQHTGIPTEMANLLASPDLAQRLAEAQKHAVTTDQAKSAQAVTTAWTNTLQAIRDCQRVLEEALQPIVLKILASVKDVAEYLKEHPKVLIDLFVVAGTAAAIFGAKTVLMINGIIARMAAIGTTATASFAAADTAAATAAKGGGLGLILGRLATAGAALATGAAILLIPTNQTPNTQQEAEILKNGAPPGKVPTMWDRMGASIMGWLNDWYGREGRGGTGAQELGAARQGLLGLFDHFLNVMQDMLKAVSRGGVTPGSATDAPTWGRGVQPASYHPGGSGGGAGSGGGPIGDDLLAQVRQREGYSATAYWDHQQYSIGYGTRANGPNEVITREEAERRLRAEVASAAATVDAAARSMGFELNDHQRDALTDFAYNVGGGALQRMMARANGNLLAIPRLMQEYNHASGVVDPGLTSRRAWEGQLFLAPGARHGGDRGATNIGPITIHSHGGDGRQIARDLRQELGRFGYVQQANTGLA